MDSLDLSFFEKKVATQKKDDVLELPGKSQAIQRALDKYRLNFLQLYLASCVMN